MNVRWALYQYDPDSIDLVEILFTGTETECLTQRLKMTAQSLLYTKPMMYLFKEYPNAIYHDKFYEGGLLTL